MQKHANPLFDEDNDGLIDDNKADEYQKVDGAMFESPMQPVGVSGGTAAFFFVKYKEGEEMKDLAPGSDQPVGSRNYWIGKDFARAQDEVDFYEVAKEFLTQPGWDMLKWMTPYGGIVRSPCVTYNDDDEGDIQERDILLLRNARDQYKTPRLLDIKIGEVTAVAGWQGKGAFMAWTQKWLDGMTNSAVSADLVADLPACASWCAVAGAEHGMSS